MDRITEGKSHKILVVDDNRDLVELYLTILGMKGYGVRGALSGRECLDELREFHPDLILLDIMMAPMDGWETLRRIRENPESGDVPVIMVTGKQFAPEELVKFGDLIDGYILKPVSPHDLNLILEQFLSWIGMIDDRAREAGKKGMDPENVREYRFLSRRVCAMEHIIPLIRGSCESSVKNLPTHPDKREIFAAIMQNLSDRKDRLGILEEQIHPCD